jgi:hypothetical protein
MRVLLRDSLAGVGAVLVLALLPGALAACGPGNVAARVAQAPTHDRESKCSITRSQSEPLVVEWPSSSRAKIEALTRTGVNTLDIILVTVGGTFFFVGGLGLLGGLLAPHDMMSVVSQPEGRQAAWRVTEPATVRF